MDFDEVEAARQQGRVEGQLDAIEKMLSQTKERLDSQERRLALQEKITWGLLGAIALVQSMDVIRLFGEQ